MRGLFISFEGNDGSGKSSAIKAVYQKLVDEGFDVVLSREPGGSKIAEKIRDVILDIDNTGMDEWTEALLYAASRREHIQKTIIPSIEKGKIVLCDRFLDSSLAYQGYARGLGIDKVNQLNQFATEGLEPDLTILVCVHPEIGLERIRKNSRDMDRLENETIQFHQKVYDGYQILAKESHNRIIVINGEETQDVVADNTIDVVLKFIKEHQ